MIIDNEDEDKFVPDDKVYMLDFPTEQYVANNIAVINGWNFRENFTLYNPNYSLITSGLNLTLAWTPITGISELSASTLAVYPSIISAGQTFTVESGKLNGAVITIYNLAGVKKSEYSAQGGITKIPAPQTQGIYIIRMSSDNGTSLGISRIVVK